MLKVIFFVTVAVVTAVLTERVPDIKNDDFVVATSGGALRGERLGCGIGCNYVSFKGVPYGAAPIGDLRFRAPQPHGGWEGTRDAFEHGNSCPGSGILFGNSNEDCLSLNVYTPSLSGKRAVMVWIHGGSFSGGSGNSFVYGPDHIVSDGVIMVSVNYRLGALGFLSTNDNNAPGNYGLKDINLALKWIQENIEAFGGDPDNVTIFGESSGGASVHYLVLSPSSEGLFSRAISQSGSALNPWAFQTNPETVAHKLAADIGISFTDNADLLNKLREVDPYVLVDATPTTAQYPVPRGLLPIPFVPSLDPVDVAADEAFLPALPIDLMTSGQFNHVPYLTGFNSAENLFSIREELIDRNVFETLNNNQHLLIPKQWNITSGSEDATTIIGEIRDFYFHNEDLSMDLRVEYSKFNTDLMFARGVDQTARIHAEQQDEPVYFYKFSFDGAMNFIKTLLFLRDYEGAMHADDIFYLFRVSPIAPPLLPNNPAIRTRRLMVRLWTNFAKSGNPTPPNDSIATIPWRPVSNEQDYYEIGSTITASSHTHLTRMAFWDRLHSQFGN